MKIKEVKVLKSIHPLPTEVINQIAAGEVVERPANLVKELIENSLDAGADKIEIHFSEGGRFVQIKDNGCGISDSELHLALSPHSTSKISSLKDIWTIKSYGFRGEALASIAEVSDLTVISRPEKQDQAGRLRSEFGKKQSVENVGSEKGTTVIVKNLFQNTPARLKFLKSESSETSLIKNTIKAMGLSHPHVEFRVLHKNRLLFYWPVEDHLQKRVHRVLALQNTFYTKTKYQNIDVEAVLCAPNETTGNRKQMWFFVGNRWVEDSTLYSAVMSAYRGLLMHGEFPIVVLKLSCPVEDLDVNVHPAKSKVRFKSTGPIFKAVHHSIRAVLEKAPWIKERKQTFTEKDQETKLEFSDREFEQTQFPTKGDINNNEEKTSSYNKNFTAVSKLSEPLSPVLQSMKMDLTKEAFETEPVKNYWSSLHILSQAHLTYILTQSREAVIFIDQHAAHERILYERLMLSWNTGKGEIQNRLVPLVLDLEESLVKSLLSMEKELLKMGLEIERSGPESIVIHSAPAILKDIALQKALVKLADEIKSVGGGFAVENKISDLCASMACHSAIRAGQALSREEMKELLIQMDEFPLSSFCPHGRPVFVEYPLSRLERDFGRVV